jgi:type II secretory pathway pseudopilin PulG
MNLKTTLIGGAAVGVALSVIAVGDVQAKPKHHARSARPSASENALQSEVKDLKAEVQSLEGRLDAQAQAQQQASAAQAAQIAAAQDAARAAQSTAQATQSQVASQIETIPAQVEEKTKKYEPLLSGWFNNTKIGGTIFSDLSYIDNRNDGKPNSQTGTDYDIKRAYISIDHKFNNMFSANITTDFTYDSTTKATQLYIKKAYLQSNLLGNEFVVRAGSADLPWVPFVEGIYGYRFAERVVTDLNGFGTSADWGVHVLGSLWDNHFGYQLSVVDGNGYKIPATGTANRTDAMDFEGRVNVNYDHFTVALGGYEGKLGHAVTGTPTFNTAERFDALAAYTGPLFHVGFEYMWANFWNDVTQPNPAKTNTSQAYSIFASVNVTKQFSIFGRYDWLKPQENTNNSFVSHYYNIGVDYKPIAPLDFALLYKHDSVTDGLLSTQNGTIGTLHANHIGNGDYDEVGVFMQWKY